jgi:hypothetical protein
MTSAAWFPLEKICRRRPGEAQLKKFRGLTGYPEVLREENYFSSKTKTTAAKK